MALIGTPGSSKFLAGGKESLNDGGGLLPLTRLPLKLLLAGASQGVILRSSVVVRYSPLRRYVAFLLQLEKGRIQSSILHRDQTSANLLNAASDAVPVER